MKIGIKETYDAIFNSPEYNQILGASREQGKIIGILHDYQEMHPELYSIIERIVEEIMGNDK